jgi:hypothetical protein
MSSLSFTDDTKVVGDPLRERYTQTSGKTFLEYDPLNSFNKRPNCTYSISLDLFNQLRKSKPKKFHHLVQKYERKNKIFLDVPALIEFTRNYDDTQRPARDSNIYLTPNDYKSYISSRNRRGLPPAPNVCETRVELHPDYEVKLLFDPNHKSRRRKKELELHSKNARFKKTISPNSTVNRKSKKNKRTDRDRAKKERGKRRVEKERTLSRKKSSPLLPENYSPPSIISPSKLDEGKQKRDFSIRRDIARAKFESRLRKKNRKHGRRAQTESMPSLTALWSDYYWMYLQDTHEANRLPLCEIFANFLVEYPWLDYENSTVFLDIIVPSHYLLEGECDCMLFDNETESLHMTDHISKIMDLLKNSEFGTRHVCDFLSLFSLVKQILGSSGPSDIVAALWQYIRTFVSDPIKWFLDWISNLLGPITDHWGKAIKYTEVSISWLLNYIREKSALLRADHPISSLSSLFSMSEDKDRAQTESLSDHLEAFAGGVKMFTKSKLFLDITNVLLSLVTFKFFSRDTGNLIKKTFGRLKKKPCLMDLAEYLFKAFLSCVRVAEAWIAGVPLTQAIFDTDPIGSLIRQIDQHILMQDFRYFGLPVKDYIEHSEYMVKSEKLLENASYYVKFVNTLDGPGAKLVEKFKDLKTLDMRLRTTSLNNRRHTPFGLLFAGPAKVGKAGLLELGAATYCKVKGIPYSPSLIYHVIKDSPFKSAYLPFQHPVWHYSELGAETSLRARNSSVSPLSEITSVIDSVPFPCNMNDNDDKGKVFAIPGLVIADSNNLHLNAHELYGDVNAVYRRFLSIWVTVKPQYADGLKLNGSLLDGSNNYWKFTIKIWDGKHFQDGEVFDEIEDFKAFLSKRMADHINNEMKYDQAKDGLLDIDNSNNDDDEEKFFPMDDFKQPYSILEDPGDSSDKYFSDSSAETESLSSDNLLVLLYTSFFFEIGWMEWFTLSRNLTRAHVRSYFSNWDDWLFVKYSKAYWNRTCAIFWCFWYLNVYLSFWCILKVTYHMVLHGPKGFQNAFVQKIIDRWIDHYRANFTMSWKRIKSTFGYLDNPFESDFYRRNSMTINAILIAMSAGAAYYTMMDKKPKQSYSESQSKFKYYSDYDISIQSKETRMGASDEYARVPIKGTQLWNEITSTEIPKFTMPSLNLFRSISRNVKKAAIYPCTDSTYILGVCKSYALISSHALPRGSDTFVVKIFYGANEDNIRFANIGEKDVFYLGNDVSLIRLFPCDFRDITQHIRSESMPKIARGSLGTYQVEARYSKCKLPVTDAIWGNYDISPFFYYTLENHRKGLCGIPLILDIGKGSQICGLHIAGGGADDSMAYATTIDKEKLLEGIKEFDCDPAVLPSFDSPAITQSLEFPNVKSLVNYESIGPLEYYGKIPGPVLINKESSVVKTPIYNSVKSKFEEEFGPVKRFAPPLMKPRGSGDNYVSPYNIGFRDFSQPRHILNQELLGRVVDQLVDRFSKSLPDLAPLSMMDAINGIDSDPFIRGINCSTSPGFGWEGHKTKRDLMYEYYGKYEPLPDLRKSIISILESYEKGERTANTYKVQLKDEPREYTKALCGKTRLFYMSSLDNLIVDRMFLSPFYTSMVYQSELFCTAVGINMYDGADRIFNSLRSFSTLIMEGDYSGYDKKMPFDIARASNTIKYRVLKNCGYNDEALRYLGGCLNDDLFPFIDLCKDYFCVPGLQPSGKYGTAEDNSLKGLILLMYAFYSIPELQDLDFFDYVLPVTYGDDMLAAVKEEISHLFNNVVYQERCLTLYGMGFTSAAKSSQMEKFLSIDDISFLKRNFVEKNGRIYAPLDYNSIARSLMWTIPSKTATRADQTVSCVNSALVELYLHNQARGKFIEWREWFTDLLVEGYEEIDRDVARLLFTFEKVQQIVGDLDASDEWTYEGKTSPFPMAVSESSSLLEEGSGLGQFQNELLGFYGGVLCKNHVPASFIDELKTELKELELESITGNSIIDALDEYQLQNIVILKENARTRSAIRKRSRALARIKDITLTIEILSRRDKLKGLGSMVLTESSHEGYMEGGTISHSDKFENVVDVTGGDVKESPDTTASVYENGQKNHLSMEGFLSRPVPITDFQIAPATSLAVRLSPWDLYTKNPTVRAKLRNHFGLKGRLKMRIAVSGTPFHYGRLLVSIQPYPEVNDVLQSHLLNDASVANYRPLLLNYLSQSPGARIMDVRDNIPLDIEIPYINPKPMFRLWNDAGTAISDVTSFEDMQEACDVFIYSINDVKSASSTPSDVSVYVYAWLEDPELGTTTATQVGITTESDHTDERKVGPIEKFASGAMEVSDKLHDVPYIGTAAKASSMFLSGLKGISSLFGWSKPVMISTPSYVKNMGFQNGNHMIGYDTNYRMTLDPKQEVSVDPINVSDPNDDMTISSICQRESYYTTFQWNDDSPVMTSLLFEEGVRPDLGSEVSDLTYKYVQPTALAFGTQPFRFWRGDIIFRFDFVCSQYHRGKILFFYEPNTQQSTIINSSISTNKQNIQILDLQDSHSIEICVEWSAYMSWLRTSDINSTYSDKFYFWNGYIGVVPLTTLQSPDDSDIDVNVFVRSENMNVNVPDSTWFPHGRHAVTESSHDVVEEEKYVSCVRLNPSTADDSKISLYHFGEQPVSFRALLKRYESSDQLSIIGTSTTRGKVRYTSPIIPTSRLPYGSGSSITDDISLFEYLRYAYVGMKGGVRKRLRTLGKSFDSIDHFKILQNTISPIEPTSSISYSTDLISNTYRGALSFVPHSNGGVEFELPYYCPNLFIFPFNSNPFSIPTGFSLHYVRAYTAEFEHNSAVTDVAFLEETAYGEDFTLMRFQGAPYYTVTL